jgi:hypothetical protein
MRVFARQGARLQVAVADAELGVGQPRGHVRVHLRVHVGVDPDQDARGRALGARRGRDVLQIKLGVHVDERALAHRQPQLLRQLAVAIEDGPARM